MNRKQFEKHIMQTYGVSPDYPWRSDPTYAVFRHPGNRKWFALVMDISPEKLGLPPGPTLEVVNLKCDPLFIGSLRQEPGLFPAYHMNKQHWITVALDGSASEETVTLLTDLSYRATRPRRSPVRPTP